MAFNPEVAKRRKRAPIELNGPPETPAQPVVVGSRNYKAASANLDSQEAVACLAQCESWWQEQVDYHATNRREQLIDNDFYDHDQWDDESVQILAERNQAALTFNLIKPVVDWAVGTERRTRVDWGVYPRTGQAVKIAETKESLLKFISDTSFVNYERSRAFKDACIVGVGWMREFLQTDRTDGPPVAARYIDWKRVRWDPFSRSNTLEDCRSISTDGYIDLDYAIALWPDRADRLRGAANRIMDPSIELLEDDALMPQVFWGQRNTIMNRMGLAGTASIGRRARPRVRVVEMEYRRPVVERRIKAMSADFPEIHGELFDETDNDLVQLKAEGKITLDDQIASHIWIATFPPGCGFLCLHRPAPYKHQKFSLTPTWCYRRHRDGMPYGIVRGLRDPQDEYNKRRSKLLFQLSTNRVLYEDDAINAEDEDDVLQEAAKPNAQIRLRSGALGGGKFKIENNVQVAEEQFKLLDQARKDVHEGSSITPENQGLETDALSGKAIALKQQQGAVGTAEIFDNYRLSIQISGMKTLSLCEQYLTRPMQIRIVGAKKTEFIGINQPTFDVATGEVIWENDITKDQCDFVVDEQDYRETVRQAQAQTLMETISRMSPDIAVKLLDLVIDLSDLPNREEFVQRIKQINGAAQFEDDADADPAAKAARAIKLQQQQAASAKEADTAQREREAKIGKDEATARKLNADADRANVDTKDQAMNVAHKVALAPAVAPVADRIAMPPRPGANPLGPGVFEAPQPSPANAVPPLAVPQPQPK